MNISPASPPVQQGFFCGLCFLKVNESFYFVDLSNNHQTSKGNLVKGLKVFVNAGKN